MFKRLVILFFNLLFPPLAVLLLCGFGADFAMNCFLFVLAIIPSHIHGMYISFVYFHRKNKVRKGRLPGRRRGLIYSEKVQNGGATQGQLNDLKVLEQDRARPMDGKKVQREWRKTG
ncbi:hypothetical protein JX265_005676 [Neoarthrinium moseri]|uniref:Proteolipid membrane potential modulator n=1 Tax=Neoarthrinium moseri TaxID=1658444 RepID=A0A9P9WMZ3_9PEZI|nr:hypothetical protein JX266_005556 [Neoarthrinium moseri]KAI1871690.1 hypothetical protein JX265_005676 [Neoarthrinium moseri]